MAQTRQYQLSVAIIAANGMKDVVHSIAKSLDDAVRSVRDQLALPSQPEKWSHALALRLASRNELFLVAATNELTVRRAALKELYPLDDEPYDDDLYTSLKSEVSRARERMRVVQDLKTIVEFLADGYMLQLEAAQTKKMDEEIPLMNQTYQRLETQLKDINSIVVQWDDVYRSVLPEDRFVSCLDELRGRERTKEDIMGDLDEFFDRLRRLCDARRKAVDECSRHCDRQTQTWFARFADRVSVEEFQIELGMYATLSHTIYSQSEQQDDILQSLQTYLTTADIEATTLPAANGEHLAFQKVPEALHQYDLVRVMIEHFNEDILGLEADLRRNLALLEEVRGR